LLEEGNEGSNFIIDGILMNLVEDFKFLGYETLEPKADIPYKPRKCTVEAFPYPADGKARKGGILYTVTMQPMSYTWFTIKNVDD